MYLFLVFLSGSLLTSGFIVFRKTFYSVAEHTVQLLNAILNPTEDDGVKQQALQKSLTRVLISLLILILSVTAAVLLSITPFLFFTRFNVNQLQFLDYSSTGFVITFISGSLFPALLFSFTGKKKSYSELSVLLHRLALNNYYVARSLFHIERSAFKKKLKKKTTDFVVVTGLARAGTTGLTELLSRSPRFHTLTYANMPFLLSPNLWRRIYRPKNTTLRERAHGDNVLFGLDTVEALEEFFFKAFLDDQYLLKDRLQKHEIPSEVYQKYIDYQNLVRPAAGTGTLYLAKNNNLLLRYSSLRSQNKEFKIILLFRKPLDHAYSLLKQHVRFSEQQGNDPFVREYMDWLGHHEFGLHHKPFALSDTFEHPKTSPNEIDYWLSLWIGYYSEVTGLPHDQNLILAEYQDFLSDPAALLKEIESRFGFSLEVGKIDPFENVNAFTGKADQTLVEKSNHIYNQLRSKKIIPETPSVRSF